MKTEPIPASGEHSLAISKAAVLPMVVAAAGQTASKRYFEFFTVTIRNEHTRSTYFRACRVFFEWCEARGLSLENIEPVHVAAYIESRSTSTDPKWHLSKTSLKNHISGLRMMFSYFVEKGVLIYNPAREVATEKVRRNIGKTPAYDTDQVAQLLAHFKAETVVQLRDRALIGVMAFGFSRISAIVNLRVRDYVQQGRRAFIRTHGKGGVEVDIPVHHQLAEYLDAYIEVAGIAEDKNGFLFRSTRGNSKQLTGNPIDRVDAWKMVQRRLDNAGIGGRIGFGCHSFRATCGTNFLTNGGELEVCQKLMGHADSRTTKLYDRRELAVSQGDIERIRYGRD
ncbi:tyrosine recombinase XerC (plasmid) [Abditibacteriota bacterium]|nr:tyrosine recombinase XerC [Abditibacteriota bacterium]